MFLLKAQHIKKNFGGVQALKDGCIECEEGKIIGLLGANGSGKTTFSKIICGLYSSNGGEIFLNGEKVEIHSAQEARSMGIAMAHQNLSLVPDLSVRENINLGHEPLKQSGGLDNKRSIEIANKIVEGLDPNISIHESVENLSPAQKQLVEIGKAISQNPKLLVLDEPTASLEQEQVKHLFTIMRRFISSGRSIIFISHRLWEVTQICDSLVVFRNGETVGTMDFKHEEKNVRKIVSLITGEESGDLTYFHTNQEKPKIRTESTSLAVNIRSGIKDQHKLDFKLYAGEIVGLSGLQGQGQPELLLTLFGSKPYTGEIKINGEVVTLHHPLDAIRSGIVFIPGDRQKEGIFNNHTVFLNSIYPEVAKRKNKSFINYRKYKVTVDEIIKRLSITPADQTMLLNQLSGGNQQKVVFGKWLFENPTIMLLDDPTKGVDINAKSELFEILNNLSKQGSTIFIYSSDNEELLSICNRILVMFEEDIIEEISGDRLTEDTLIAAALRGNHEN